jgi:hypothetical protein
MKSEEVVCFTILRKLVDAGECGRRKGRPDHGCSQCLSKSSSKPLVLGQCFRPIKNFIERNGSHMASRAELDRVRNQEGLIGTKASTKPSWHLSEPDAVPWFGCSHRTETMKRIGKPCLNKRRSWSVKLICLVLVHSHYISFPLQHHAKPFIRSAYFTIHITTIMDV